MSERYLTVTMTRYRDYTARLFDKETGELLDVTTTITVWGAKRWARRWKRQAPMPGDRVWAGEI